MLAVHLIAWFCCIGSTAFCAATVYLRRKELRGDSEQNNSQFRGLQRQFIFPYLSVLLAESFQAPYLYALFYSYHYVPFQISALYAVGIASNVIFSFYCVHLSARYGRRVLCLLCLAVGSFACCLKFFASFPLLLIGRLLDGVFAALVAAPFQQWYNHEHLISFDFPSEWLSSTFTFVSLGSGFLAVLAGLLSQLTVSISKEVILPFVFSIFALIVGGLFIGSKWQENKPVDAPLPLRTVLGKAVGILRTSPLALVLCLVASCMESTVQMFIFLWSPVFIKSNIVEHSQLSLGVIYGALVAAYLCGLTIFSSPLIQRISNSKLLTISSITAFLSLFSSLSAFPVSQSGWPSARFDRIFLAFLCFEVAIGVYNPSMNALQDSLLPGPQRSALLALLRIPVSFIASMAILVLFPTSGGEHKMMILGICLLGLCSTLSIVLDVVLSRRYRSERQDPNHIYFPEVPAQIH